MGVSDIYLAIKDAATFANKIGNHELYSKILDAQAMALELQEENHKLRLEIERLKNDESIKENLISEDGAYYLKIESGSKDGPFCTACWDSDSKLIRLHLQDDYNGGKQGHCPICKNYSETLKSI